MQCKQFSIRFKNACLKQKGVLFGPLQMLKKKIVYLSKMNIKYEFHTCFYVEAEKNVSEYHKKWEEIRKKKEILGIKNGFL